MNATPSILVFFSIFFAITILILIYMTKLTFMYVKSYEPDIFKAEIWCYTSIFESLTFKLLNQCHTFSLKFLPFFHLLTPLNYPMRIFLSRCFCFSLAKKSPQAIEPQALSIFLFLKSFILSKLSTAQFILFCYFSLGNFCTPLCISSIRFIYFKTI